jgi:group I intron endonuclease
MSIYSIYKITNNVTGKIYIGFCSNFKKRIYRHKYNAFTLKKEQYLYNSMRKYGLENFSFEEIYSSKDKDHCLFEMEPFFIKEYNPEYNMTKGGEGCLGYKHTEKTKTFLSELNKTKIGIKNNFYGKSHTPEAIEKNRQKNIEIQTKKSGKKINQYSLDGTFIQTHISIRSAARELNKSHPSIINCCEGKLKQAHGYIWGYAD